MLIILSTNGTSGDELVEARNAEEDEVQPPNYRNLTPMEMVHSHRERIVIEETEEANRSEDIDDGRRNRGGKK